MTKMFQLNLHYLKEIRNNCLTFLIAGFDTTANTLGFVSWLLATNPEVQEKLREEIDENIDADTDITYETVQKLKYLDAVTKEGLRFYPIAALSVFVVILVNIL